MRAAVFLKYVLDPEILSRDFSLDPATGLPTTTFPSYQFDQYDRIALEIALKLRDKGAQLEISAVCVGPEAAEDRLRDALAVKVDEAVLAVADRALSDHDRARLLAAWTMRHPDLAFVLCGRMTSDTDSSEIGPVVAESLGWPLLSNVVGIETREGRVVCKREVAEGFEWRFVDGPFVATATNAPDTVPRKAKLQDVMRAQRQPIVRMQAAELGDAAASRRGLMTQRTYIPDVARGCQWIDGGAPEDKARNLAEQLLPLLGRNATAVADNDFKRDDMRVVPSAVSGHGVA